ncbi:uncharacterized protein LOC107220476 [Neodiprion lecontei]|uniref:Uncharacterized protein LOC107220476 n=1 Tax=Neodiprion lecontei TaxID=441921 RepID=A0A6J0BJ51_NEOLC|nr:uncharacterized protein LOC107220476 [Neodiprion lecontei]
MVNSHAVLSVLLLLVSTISRISGNCEGKLKEYSCNGGDISDLKIVQADVEVLQISDMKVPKLSVDALKRFNQLQIFSCSNCSIREIEPGVFQNKYNLEQLTLNNNHLTSVKANWIQGPEYLTYLDLTHNKITGIEPSVYKLIENLAELRLSGNPIECLDTKAMSNLKSLRIFLLDQVPTFKCPRLMAEFVKQHGITAETDKTWKEIQVSEQDEKNSYAKAVEAAEKLDRIVSTESTPIIPIVTTPRFFPITQRPLELLTSVDIDIGEVLTTNTLWREPKSSTPKPVPEILAVPSTTETSQPLSSSEIIEASSIVTTSYEQESSDIVTTTFSLESTTKVAPVGKEKATPVIPVAVYTSASVPVVHYPPPSPVPTVIMPAPNATNGEPERDESLQFASVFPPPYDNVADSQPGEQHELVSPTTVRQTVPEEETDKPLPLCNDAGQGLRNAGRYAIGIFVVVFCLGSL